MKPRHKTKYGFFAVLSVFIILTGCGRKPAADNDMLIEEASNDILVTNDFSAVEMEDAPVEDKGVLYSELQKDIAAGNLSDPAVQGTSCMLMPILQNPTADSVTVQWFTEGEGTDNVVMLYESPDSDTPFRTISADTFKMSRLRGGKTEKTCNDPAVASDIHKHTAVVDGLPEYHGYMSERVYYRISSNGEMSDMYSLAACPNKGTPLRILLTSDLQIKKMCTANFQKVFETTGHVDAVFCNGDLVDVPDRVYDWFYADNAFWRVFTGTADDNIGGRSYCGAPFLQEAPIFTSIGNHDVMGVYDEKTDLSVQFNNPLPREYAENLWKEKARNDNADGNNISEAEFIKNNSYNTITYEEMFELPDSSGTEKYYSMQFGDIGLITLDVSRVWRLPNVGISGKYSELPGVSKKDYGYGDFIFEPVTKGSPQIDFFEKALQNGSFIDSKYKVVMFHSEAHSLGDNAIPAFTDPVAKVHNDSLTGLDMAVYNYPLSNDYIHNIIEPMAESYGTDLLFNAHSHLWNRFITGGGMNVLETSNVGNTYGAYFNGGRRSCVPSALNEGDLMYSLSYLYENGDYPYENDPHGLTPVEPNVASLPDNNPYLSSNTVTAFSILDTQSGRIDSYYFDTESPDSDVVLFDSFDIKH